MENIKNTNTVKSIIKAFAIIEALDEEGPLSIGELSKILVMDKATVHRLINTVKDIGSVKLNFMLLLSATFIASLTASSSSCSISG